MVKRNSYALDRELDRRQGIARCEFCRRTIDTNEPHMHWLSFDGDNYAHEQCAEEVRRG